MQVTVVTRALALSAQALKSIYSYSFEVVAPCAAESDSESCPSPILSRGQSSTAAHTVNHHDPAATQAGALLQRASEDARTASKGKGPAQEELACDGAATPGNAGTCEADARPSAQDSARVEELGHSQERMSLVGSQRGASAGALREGRGAAKRKVPEKSEGGVCRGNKRERDKARERDKVREGRERERGRMLFEEVDRLTAHAGGGAPVRGKASRKVGGASIKDTSTSTSTHTHTNTHTNTNEVRRLEKSVLRWIPIMPCASP